MNLINITVLGTGYVGLVSGVCFAECGHKVTCVDTNKKKIDILKKMKSPICEVGLEELMVKNAKAGRLSFDSSLVSSINSSDIIIIAVGTPSLPNSNEVNLSYIYQCVDDICSYLGKNMVVIVKSTVPIGTCDDLQKKIDSKSMQYKCTIVSNPEFLREGVAVNDFMNPDRIVIGINEDIFNKKSLEHLYANHISRGVECVYTNRKSAEMIKYSSNAFLAMKVAFINEISDLAEKYNADISDVSRGMGLDTRIGRRFLNPGPGFGGSCFPKDVKALIDMSNSVGLESSLISSIKSSNDSRAINIANRILSQTQKNDVVSFLGVTFKAETDDVRDSPIIPIINEVLAQGRSVKIYDPAGIGNAKGIFVHEESKKKISYFNDALESVKESSLAVIGTEWKEFKQLDPIAMKSMMKKSQIYDLRNIVNYDSFRKANFIINCIGKHQNEQ